MDTKRQIVADVMKIDPIVIHVHASLDEADLALRSTFIRGIPVVDGGGRLVGTISHASLAAHRFTAVNPIRTETEPVARGRADARLEGHDIRHGSAG